MHTPTLTFVVGTGRTGSTALSTIANQHPDILSLNELFASMPEETLGQRPMDGREFWRLLAEPNAPFSRMLRSGAPMPEFLYNHLPQGRYSSEGGVPALSLMALPHLTAEPDALLDELAAEVIHWPIRQPAEHWRTLFATLAARFGGPRAAVERSGYSLGRIPTLRALFPQARFVHLYRDGPDCAVSMHRHVGYRMIFLMREIATRCQVSSLHELTAEHIAQLPDDLGALLAERFDPALLTQRPLPVEEFASLWSQLVVEGTEHLEKLPSADQLPLSYDQLVQQPHQQLTRLAEFVGVQPLPGWLEEGSALLSDRSRGSALSLPERELDAVRESCAPGMRALQRSGGVT